MIRPFAATLLLCLSAMPAAAAGISTHVLDLAAGAGRQGVVVTLLRRAGTGWSPVAEARTDVEGRVRAFGPADRFGAGTYKLHFDMAANRVSRPFFPEIDIVFEVTDAPHYHVPLVVSPYGYSTYRGT